MTLPAAPERTADVFTAADYSEVASTIRKHLNEDDLRAVLSNRLNVILGALDAAASDEWRQKYIDASNALWMFENPPDPSTLRQAADEFDCGSDCRFGSIEWDTNSHICSKRDTDGCPGDLAAHLRQFADAIDLRAASTRTK